MQLLSPSRLPHLSARAPEGALRSRAAPSFARAGEYEVLCDPFRARPRVIHVEPDKVELSTRLTLVHRAAPVLVHWEVARDARFDEIECYGLFFAHPHLDYQVRVALDGLSPGRGYWARLWAGGSWSPTARVHTASHLRARARVRASTDPAVAQLYPVLVRGVARMRATPRSGALRPVLATGPADL